MTFCYCATAGPCLHIGYLLPTRCRGGKWCVFKLRALCVQCVVQWNTRNSAIADTPRDALRDINLRKYRDLETGVSGHWRSLEISPFDRTHATSYWYSVVTMALSSVISEIFNVKKMSWPWNPGPSSLKVNESGTIR